MDHRISKDMISSGMIPSGEKNQEDLSRTQYGSAPSPNALADAYKSMYDKKEEVINEHHKKDADGNTIPHDDDVKEAKVDDTKIFNVAGDRNVRRFGKEGQFNPDGSGPRGQDTSEKAKLAVKRGEEHKARRGVKTGSVGSPIGTTEEVDLFDVLSNKLIEEGYSKKESYKIMSNLTEEQLEELNEFVISGTLATLGAIGGKLAAATAGLAKGAMVAGKAGLAAGTKGLAAAGKGLAAGGKAAMKGVVSAAKPVTKSATAVKDLAGKGASSAKDIASKGVSSAKNMASNVGQQVKKVPSTQPTGGSGEDRLKRIKDFAKREIGQETKRRVLQGGGQPAGTNKTGFASAAKTDIAASADLFDIVKGQLLDEGLSEEEIKDIMLTLTPDEILSEIKDYQMDSLKRQTAPGGGKDYKIEDKKNVQNLAKKEVLKPFEKKGARTKSGIVGSYVEKPTTEEYKNFDPKNPDPKQMKAQAQQEKNRQKFNDPMGAKNANIGGRGKDLG